MGPVHRLRMMAIALLALTGAGAAGAQLLPGDGFGQVLGGIGRAGDMALDAADRTVSGVANQARALADTRIDRLNGLVRANREVLEMTRLGPAVRGEIVAVDPDARTIEAARKAGFAIVAHQPIEGLGIRSVTLRAPSGLSLRKAMARLRRAAPDGEFTPNHLHLQSAATSVPALAGAVLAGGGPGPAAIGIIDGGVAAHPSIGRVEQRGFVSGAPAASAHGTAVASLAAGKGAVRGAAPGAGLIVADVYGRDPKGGNAVAIARALGLMAQRDVKVVAMSLVGPPNPLVAKAIGRALAKGIHVVAAVGNDGPAAPLAFPASYKGVIAVTGVDARNRPLIEAGRSLHLDFAAPGADMAAAAADGGVDAVRGTSYAVPLVAGRLARSSLPALTAQATDLGPKGPDKSYGRGLVCGECRTPIPKK